MSDSLPGSCPPNWLQGNPSTTNCLTFNRRYRDSRPAYCGVNPHRLATLTMSSERSRYVAMLSGWPSMVVTDMSYKSDTPSSAIESLCGNSAAYNHEAPISQRMKIATWNVNGIRARDAQLHEFLEREQPDALCLQEIKASLEQLPVWLCDIEGYWCYWHGGRGYSGVGLHVRKTVSEVPPEFHHPGFDYEHRIVVAQLPELTVASVYVPNGGKDFPAKMQFMEALASMAEQYEASGRLLVLS